MAAMTVLQTPYVLLARATTRVQRNGLTFQQATLSEHGRACLLVRGLATTDLSGCCCTSEELMSAVAESMPRNKTLLALVV